jgi:hypothetical protein
MSSERWYLKGRNKYKVKRTESLLERLCDKSEGFPPSVVSKTFSGVESWHSFSPQWRRKASPVYIVACAGICYLILIVSMSAYKDGFSTSKASFLTCDFALSIRHVEQLTNNHHDKVIF